MLGMQQSCQEEAFEAKQLGGEPCSSSGKTEQHLESFRFLRAMSQDSTEVGFPCGHDSSEEDVEDTEAACKGHGNDLLEDLLCQEWASSTQYCDQVIAVACDGTAAFVPPCCPPEDPEQWTLRLSESCWLELGAGGVQMVSVAPDGTAYCRRPVPRKPVWGRSDQSPSEDDKDEKEGWNCHLDEHGSCHMATEAVAGAISKAARLSEDPQTLNTLLLSQREEWPWTFPWHGSEEQQTIAVARDGTARYLTVCFLSEEGREQPEPEAAEQCHAMRLSKASWLEVHGGDVRVVSLEPEGTASCQSPPQVPGAFAAAWRSTAAQFGS